MEQDNYIPEQLQLDGKTVLEQFLSRKINHTASEVVRYSIASAQISDIYPEKSDSEQREIQAFWMSEKERFEWEVDALTTIASASEKGEIENLLADIDPEKKHRRLPLSQKLTPVEKLDEVVMHVVSLIKQKQDKEKDEQQSILTRIDEFSDELLESAVSHTEVWRRASFRVANPNQFYLDLMSSGFEGHVKNHAFPDLTAPTQDGYPELVRKELPGEYPEDAYISVEGFDHSAYYGDRHGKWKDITLGLSYKNSSDIDTIRLHMRVGEPRITSDVLSTDLIETGYEGHDHRSEIIFSDKLQSFYGILKKYATNSEPETPFYEQMKRIKMVNEQTGQELFYDEEAKDWISSETSQVEKDEKNQ